ncbi:MAG: GreA/GreB family elongation factor [Polyangiaceae bacterium]
MSKAFKKDDEAEAPLLARRAPLPDGVPNYVTASGLRALHAEHAALLSGPGEASALEDAARRMALKARLAELEQRLSSAVLVDPHAGPSDQVRFGASVELLDADGKRRAYRIVGVDEADPSQGRVAFVAPLARALLGKRVGDAVLVRAPHGEDELELTRIDYTEPAD